MGTVQSQTTLVPLLGRSIEVAFHQLTDAAGTILLLHEALGSISYWKDFPERLALAAGVNVLVYSRVGHGDSEGPPVVRTPASYLNEAEILMPALLSHFGVVNPIVYGHSEGAGLAILYAACTQQARALILESPFVVASENSRLYILGLAAQYDGSDLQERLQKYHRNADPVFAAWIAAAERLQQNDSPLREFLPRVTCPVLLMQGADDEFGTAEHRNALLAAWPNLQHVSFAGAGHLPHRQQTDALLESVKAFVKSTVTVDLS